MHQSWCQELYCWFYIGCSYKKLRAILLREKINEKYFSLILAIVTVLVFTGLVAKNEWHLHQSKSIFIKLKPIDPRSILQGDYMALAYELNLQSLKSPSGSEGNALDQVIFNHAKFQQKLF